MEEKLQQLKIMLGIDDTDEDELLTLLLTQSGKKIVRAVYPYGSTDEDVPSRYSFSKLKLLNACTINVAQRVKPHTARMV